MLIMGLGSRWMMITRRTCAYDKINFPFNQVLDIQVIWTFIWTLQVFCFCTSYSILYLIMSWLVVFWFEDRFIFLKIQFCILWYLLFLFEIPIEVFFIVFGLFPLIFLYIRQTLISKTNKLHWLKFTKYIKSNKKNYGCSGSFHWGLYSLQRCNLL